MAARRATATEGPHAGPGPTADAAEVARFADLAASWWDPRGPLRPLHRLNPVRLRYVRDRLAGHFGREAEGPAPLAGLSLLDVGCGGGLIAEPLCRLGARVTGIDAAAATVAVAALHARQAGLAIAYRALAPEDLAAEVAAGSGAPFDAVVSLEVIEHVAEPDAFLAALGRLVRPGGALVLATLNRTLKSLLLAKIGAEYVLRWLPVGTHDWRRFVTPSELGEGLARHGLRLREVSGVVYSPMTDSWRLAGDADVNYMAYAVREAAPGG
ncbi:MAG: bifunctional 2-polyprenyl-6-hydroxyphenol methylase/3-demethylubiquinol 3-O-methyltransferase UbiG [Proteobacteria bacterium]|nr:bifunctional 2-polyprenyl-6-hydroxyphenol methylase/3-demethylubiquinol 3-O-methyltransferase UbiG [Pseudomonadota bacterium]